MNYKTSLSRNVHNVCQTFVEINRFMLKALRQQFNIEKLGQEYKFLYRLHLTLITLKWNHWTKATEKQLEARFPCWINVDDKKMCKWLWPALYLRMCIIEWHWRVLFRRITSAWLLMRCIGNDISPPNYRTLHSPLQWRSLLIQTRAFAVLLLRK